MVDSTVSLPRLEPRGNRSWVGALPTWRAEGSTCPSHALAENTLEPRTGRASLSESQVPGAGWCARARRQAMQRAGISLSPWASTGLKAPKTHPPKLQRELQAARAPQEAAAGAGPKERGGGAESGESEPRLHNCPSPPTSSLRTDHILLLCGQQRPGAGEGGRAWTNQWGEKGGARGNVLVAMGIQLLSPAPGSLDRE